MLKINYKIVSTDLTRDIRKWADGRAKIMRKALSLAVSQVAYKLYRSIRQDLKTGDLGLKPKSRYRNIRLDKRYRTPRGRYAFVPLSKLFSGILYNTNWRGFVAGSQKNASWDVGFLGTTAGTQWQRRIAEKSMHGYTWAYPAHAREYLREMGIHLRRTTTSARVPPRDIVGAARKKYPEHRMMQEIRVLFDRKIRGERI